MILSRAAEYQGSPIWSEDGTLKSRAFADSLLQEDWLLSHQSHIKKGA